MKGLIFLCTLILTGVTLWGLKDVSSDDFGSTEIAGAAQMTIEKPKPTTAASVTAAPKPTEDACMIWGGFPVGDLVRVRLHLKRQHLEDKVLIQDRFGPERFIAYLGPYDNPTAARAFVKQFRQQGYGTVRPILSGELSYGVEIASFGTRKEAEAFLTGKRAPDMKGIKITNRLGEPTGMVDLVFQNLTKDETLRLQLLHGHYPRTLIRTCGTVTEEKPL